MSENYMNKVIESYKVYKNDITSELEEINNFQRKNKQNELCDITIRCTNTIARTMKYFNEHNMDYENYEKDAFLMEAVKYYIQKKMINAYGEYIKFKHQYKDVTKTKIIDTDKNNFLKKHTLLRHEYTFELTNNEKLKNVEKYADNYLKISEEILNFDFEKDIYELIYNYIYGIHNALCDSNKFDLNNEKVKKALHLRYDVTLSLLNNSLEKENLTQGIYALEKARIEIFEEDLMNQLKEEKNKYDKEKTLEKTK